MVNKINWQYQNKVMCFFNILFANRMVQYKLHRIMLTRVLNSDWPPTLAWFWIFSFFHCGFSTTGKNTNEQTITGSKWKKMPECQRSQGVATLIWSFTCNFHVKVTGKGYQPQLSASADNPYLDLDYSGYHQKFATSSSNCFSYCAGTIQSYLPSAGWLGTYTCTFWNKLDSQL